MKKQYKTLLPAIIMVWCGFTGFSQDVGFTQFYDQPLLRNPALAGIFTGDIRLTAAYRNQWQSVTVPYRTFAVNAELKTTPLINFQEVNVTWGLQVLRDVAGTSEFSTTQILPAVNISFPLSYEQKSFLSVAFMPGLMQQRFDPSKLVLNDQFVTGSNGSLSVLPSSRQVFDNTNTSFFDFSAGLSYNGELRGGMDYFIGSGLFHLKRPNVGFFDNHTITLNRKLTVNFGLTIPSGTEETDQVVIYADYFKQFGERFTPVGIGAFQYGLLFSKDIYVYGDVQHTITAGLLHRVKDALIPVFRLQIDKVIFGFSYDINTSKLVTASNYRGGFELTISYRGAFNRRDESLQQVMCPEFGK